MCTAIDAAACPARAGMCVATKAIAIATAAATQFQRLLLLISNLSITGRMPAGGGHWAREVYGGLSDRVYAPLGSQARPAVEDRWLTSTPSSAKARGQRSSTGVSKIIDGSATRLNQP